MNDNHEVFLVEVCSACIIIILNYVAQNVLIFDGGRIVKLCDFSTAVIASEAQELEGMRYCTPYFAAPEIVRLGVPRFSADIWSTLCILVEMLTARWPGYHHAGRNEFQMMFLVSGST
jgi:serine/threonine protein kinase